MKNNILKFILITLLVTGLDAQAARYTAGAQIGYNAGPGLRIDAMVSELSPSFPLYLQLGLGYAQFNPGSAADSRRIFINDATNGEPHKKGWMWDLRFDFLYKINLFSLQQAHLFAGPRYSLFTGNFNYVGGNEDFDVVSNQWGLGMGIKNFFHISRSLDFVVTTGLDYFFESELQGHDTAYSPDGEHRNNRRDYGYGDADAAVNQPTFQFHFLFGINYAL